MADVNSRRKRASEHGTGNRTDTIRRKNLAQIIVVPGRRGAFHIVHRFGEVVDAERNRRCKQRRYAGQSTEYVTGEPWQVQPEVLEGLADFSAFHVIAPAESCGQPADGCTENDCCKPTGNATRKADVRSPRDQHDGKAYEGDPWHFPHLKRRTHG